MANWMHPNTPLYQKIRKELVLQHGLVILSKTLIPKVSKAMHVRENQEYNTSFRFHSLETIRVTTCRERRRQIAAGVHDRSDLIKLYIHLLLQVMQKAERFLSRAKNSLPPRTLASKTQSS